MIVFSATDNLKNVLFLLYCHTKKINRNALYCNSDLDLLEEGHQIVATPTN